MTFEHQLKEVDWIAFDYTPTPTERNQRTEIDWIRLANAFRRLHNGRKFCFSLQNLNFCPDFDDSGHHMKQNCVVGTRCALHSQQSKIIDHSLKLYKIIFFHNRFEVGTTVLLYIFVLYFSRIC